MICVANELPYNRETLTFSAMIQTNTTYLFFIKWVIFLPLILIAGASAEALGQQSGSEKMTSNHLQEVRSIHDIRVSLHVEDATLKDVLQQLESQMGLRFMYNNEVIEESLHRFSLDIESSSAADILRNISARTGLTFRQINGRTEIDVTMEAVAIMGEELVVVGYGVQRAEEVTGSVGRIRSQSIETQPVSNLADALQGMTVSLTLQRDSGEPGAGSRINIRGISTMNNNSPLIVIDGVVGGDLSHIAPQDIEDISVLKDAGSAAIYGSRAASGVILITTRGGQRNTEPQVSFSNRTGVNVPDIRYEPVSGYQNAILRNQMLVNSGNTPIYTPEQIRRFHDEGDSEWFMHTIFQPAIQQDYNLAVAGGSDHTTYRVSARYVDHENDLVGDYGMKRYNFRVNLDTRYAGFDVQTRMAFQRSDITNHTSSTGTLVADAKRTPPYFHYTMKADNGRYLLNDVLSEFNPLGMLEAAARLQSKGLLE